MSIDRRIGKKPAEFSLREDATVRLDSGPYIGVIKNNIDPLRKGRLQIWIPDLGGAENESQNWVTVGYASPFIGSTLQDNKSTNSSYQTVNHTYGMWFIPPDLGNQVLVTFVAGDPNRGYWFACVSPHVSHNMIPGLAASAQWNLPDTLSELPEGIQKQAVSGYAYPTLEFSENDSEKREPGYLQKNSRPLHQNQFLKLVEQGLENDPIRGTHTASSQREAPSNVFGISTPGRPDKTDAEIQELNRKINAGAVTDLDLIVRQRKGGHTFFMDDGDVEGGNQMVKLRTAGGHQIVMHDSGQTMYISNSSGSVWIELSDSGQLHIYSNSGLNVRSGGNINLHSDQNININAGGSVNIKAKEQIKSESDELHLSSTKNTKVYSTNIEMLADQNINAKGSQILLNSGTAPEKPTPLTVYELTDTKFNDSRQVWDQELKSLASIANIVPTHEPYARKTGKPLSGDGGNEDVNAGTVTKVTIVPVKSQNITLKTIDGSVVTDSSGNPIGTGSNAGPSGAQGKPIVNKLMPVDLTSAPTPPGGVGDLSTSETRALMAQLGFRESSNNYSAVNQLGYLGKYQFGAAALVDRGYIKLESYRSLGNAALSNPSSWTGKDNITSKEGFLASPQIQEKVMFEQMSANYAQMKRNGRIVAGDDKSTISGMLAVAHLLGPNSNWRSTGAGSDANGVGGAEYFNLGRYSAEVLSRRA